MAYIKISDRNLKNVEVKIISRKLGLHPAIVRDDRRNRYISDYILFLIALHNKTRGANNSPQ